MRDRPEREQRAHRREEARTMPGATGDRVTIVSAAAEALFSSDGAGGRNDDAGLMMACVSKAIAGNGPSYHWLCECLEAVLEYVLDRKHEEEAPDVMVRMLELIDTCASEPNAHEDDVDTLLRFLYSGATRDALTACFELPAWWDKAGSAARYVYNKWAPSSQASEGFFDAHFTPPRALYRGAPSARSPFPQPPSLGSGGAVARKLDWGVAPTSAPGDPTDRAHTRMTTSRADMAATDLNAFAHAVSQLEESFDWLTGTRSSLQVSRS